MKDNCTITIATVVYNGAATIAETIESVLAQSYRDIEYIIVDGASKDDTPAVIQQYAGRYPNIKIKSELDNGIYDAMNKAQQMATGEFLLFLGCDDVLYNDTVIEEFAKLATDKNSTYYGDVLAKDTKEVRYGRFNTEKLIMQNLSHQSVFYSKTVYKSIAYNLKYTLFSDWDYNMKVWTRYGPFTRIELVVTVFGEGGLSSQQDAVFSADRKELVAKYFGSKYLWLIKMQRMKQKLIGNTDLRKVKGYFFHKLK